jgi:hypothetical protein
MAFLLEIRPNDLFLRRRGALKVDRRQNGAKSGGFCSAKGLRTRSTFAADQLSKLLPGGQGHRAKMAGN